jgi:rare lipoprotein A
MRFSFFLAASCFALGCGGRNEGFKPPVTSTHADARGSSAPTTSSGDLAFAKDAKNTDHAKADQVGNATWYGGAFAGKKTANGERFDPNLYTAAHRKLPFGTWVEVRRPDTGRVVRVRINDRGPWGHEDRIIDLSRKAAEDIDIVRAGVARVEVRVVSGP